MRSVLHGDIVAAARVLLLVPPRARRTLCRRMIVEAEFAHRYVKKLNKVHAFWGDGSLMSAARKRPIALEPTLSDLGYCACLEMVLRELTNWRIEKHFRSAGM